MCAGIIYVCVSMQKPEVNFGHRYSVIMYLVFKDRVYRCPRTPSRPGCLDNRLWQSIHLPSPFWGTQGPSHHTSGSGAQTQSFMLAGQALYQWSHICNASILPLPWRSLVTIALCKFLASKEKQWTPSLSHPLLPKASQKLARSPCPTC